MNAKNIQRMIHFLENGLFFQYPYYADGRDNVDSIPEEDRRENCYNHSCYWYDNECTTPGCLSGHIVEQFNLNPDDIETAIQDVFNISFDAAEILKSGDFSGNEVDVIAPVEVAGALRHLLFKGDVAFAKYHGRNGY